MDNLTIEQQFHLRKFTDLVNNMSREQAQEFLVKLYTDNLVRENYYKELIGKSWGFIE